MSMNSEPLLLIGAMLLDLLRHQAYQNVFLGQQMSFQACVDYGKTVNVCASVRAYPPPNMSAYL